MTMKIVDEIVPEPAGGAHTDAEGAAQMLRGPLRAALEQASAMSSAERLERRYEKFRQMGNIGVEDLGPTR